MLIVGGVLLVELEELVRMPRPVLVVVFLLMLVLAFSTLTAPAVLLRQLDVSGASTLLEQPMPVPPTRPLLVPTLSRRTSAIISPLPTARPRPTAMLA